MKVLKNIACFLGVGVCASSLSPAEAIQYKGASVYKATENNVTTVYLDGTAGSRVAVDLGQVSRTISRVAGACGQITISKPKGNNSFTDLKVDGTAIDYSALPTQTLPACKNGTLAEARSANFKTAHGQVVIVGKSPGASVSITVPAEATRNIAINNCGFGVLKASTGSTLPTSFKVNGTSYTLSSVVDAGHGPVCRRGASGTYSAYTPTNWSSP
ncbi:MAG: hypothetical protein PUP91_38610 [Rhizonema sp. PD37]|nr:hypothetical protein [Rhizonema sp. PD37]